MRLGSTEWILKHEDWSRWALAAQEKRLGCELYPRTAESSEMTKERFAAFAEQQGHLVVITSAGKTLAAATTAAITQNMKVAALYQGSHPKIRLNE